VSKMRWFGMAFTRFGNMYDITQFPNVWQVAYFPKCYSLDLKEFAVPIPEDIEEVVISIVRVTCSIKCLIQRIPQFLERKMVGAFP